MSHFCTKFSCPNRVTYGSENDVDVVNIICPKCERLLFISEKRKQKLNKRRNWTIFFLSLLIVAYVVYINKEMFFNHTTSTPIKKKESKEILINISDPVNKYGYIATKPYALVYFDYKDMNRIKDTIKYAQKVFVIEQGNYVVKNTKYYKIKYDNYKKGFVSIKSISFDKIVIKDKLEENIKALLKAEDSRNFDEIKKYYPPVITRYWSSRYIDKNQLETLYLTAWKKTSYSKNEIKRIEKINDHTYILYTHFTFFFIKEDIEKEVDSKVQFIFDNNGKIDQVYGIE